MASRLIAGTSYIWQTKLEELRQAHERPKRLSFATTVASTPRCVCTRESNHAKRAGSNHVGVLKTAALSTSTASGKRRCIR